MGLQGVRVTQEPPNPSGLCWCGCGQKKTELAKQGARSTGDVGGTPRRYVSGHTAYKSFSEYSVDQATGCWVWSRFIGPDGYGHAYIRKPGKERAYTQIVAHRLVYQREKGPIPEGFVLHHICGNRACVNPEHLTPLSNKTHRITHGKLTAEDFATIRGRVANGERRAVIAKDYNINTSYISMIVNGQRGVR